MNYKHTDTDKLENLIADNPVSKIRLTINGLPVCSWNAAKQSKEDHFKTKIKPFLLSSETAGGQYYLEGKNAGYGSKQSIFTLAKIDKPGTQMEFEEKTKKSIKYNMEDENKGYLTLIKENADLVYKNQYLENQISDLKNLITELEETIDNLEAEIEENEEINTLSENPINQILSEARPLIQPLLAVIITIFLTPKNLTNPPTQTQYQAPPNDQTNETGRTE